MNDNVGKMSMDSILDASFGEASNDIEVTFKKTTLIRDYETEVTECTTTVKLDYAITGIERIFITALIRVQLEYETYISLNVKGLVTDSQLKIRRKSLEEEMYAIKDKADSLLGKGVIDKYIKDNMNG